ncbi:MAG: aminotransferase class I/II-fold pyridoxal phosphate-dependent enzyme, partial [Bacteroidales bacterium]|nr:aminotransferase class I/II-fold pyridoxal phosphate-dependent enzyme [Bacteroidales bacterium]
GAYGMSHKELSDKLINEARVVLNDGTTFGGEKYECCFRINLGCPRSMLKEGLERIEKMVNGEK